jgi:hypothetical protein
MWTRLLKGLGATRANKKPLLIEHMLEINDSREAMFSLDDAVWTLRAVTGYDGAIRLFACYCAEYVLDIFEREFIDDKHRPRKAIETAKLFARGRATSEDLTAASSSAKLAEKTAWAAAEAARAAAEAAGAGDTRAALAAWGAWDAAWIARATESDVDAFNAQCDDFRREFLRLCRLEGEYAVCR